MKRLFCSLLMVLFALASSGQLVVSDPTVAGLTIANKGMMVKQLEEASRQTYQLSQTYQQIKKGVDLYEKVSNKLREAADVEDIFNRQTQLIMKASDAFKAANKIKSPSARAASDYVRNLNSVVDDNRKNIKRLTDMLTDGIFKLSESDRMKFIQEIKSQTEAATRKINSYQSAYTATSTAVGILKDL